MDQIHVSSTLFLLISFFFFNGVVEVRSQGSPEQMGDVPTSTDVVSNFQPSLAVVIGILLIMFSITFLLLIYAKFCHRGGGVGAGDGDLHLGGAGALTRSRRFSGIDKTVIESLPFFRFSSLKGSREGLECAVCLSKFEDVEILRLLPKCKHAFHIDCIDNWLERHSTCPLCRHKVSSDDPSIFAYSNSMRILNQSDIRQDSNLEIFIEREEEDRSNHGSSRFGIVGSSFRKILNGISSARNHSKDEEQSRLDTEEKTEQLLHKYNHRIVMSDVVFKNRWSNVSSSDLMFLNSEMLGAFSSDRFCPPEPSEGNNPETAPRPAAVDNDQLIVKIKEEMDRKRLFESKLSSINKNSLVSIPSSSDTEPTIPNYSRIVNSKVVSPGEKRSQSEITGMTRFMDLNMKGRYTYNNEGHGHGDDRMEERRRQLWFPIARRTVQWFANRERRSQDSHQDRISKQTPDLDV